MTSVLLIISIVILFFPVCYPMDMLNIPEEDILDVYMKYREAAGDGSRRTASRRFSKNDMEYQIHVERLKGVNGYKAHNLIIRSGVEPGSNKTMYINNPIESKLPQAYLTLDEFKQALVNRVKKNNATLEKAKFKAKVLRLWKMKRIGRKFTESHRHRSGKSKKSRTKNHRPKIIPNPLVDHFKVNITIPTKDNIYENSTKQQYIANVPQVDDITNKILFANKTETTLSYKNPVQLPNQNVTEDISEISIETTPNTTTSIEQDKIIEETVTEGDLNLETTAAETTEPEVIETTITEETTTESTTVETVPPTTVSKRITLGRPAVYMGDVR